MCMFMLTKVLPWHSAVQSQPQTIISPMFPTLIPNCPTIVRVSLPSKYFTSTNQLIKEVHSFKLFIHYSLFKLFSYRFILVLFGYSICNRPNPVLAIRKALFCLKFSCMTYEWRKTSKWGLKASLTVICRGFVSQGCSRYRSHGFKQNNTGILGVVIQPLLQVLLF